MTTELVPYASLEEIRRRLNTTPFFGKMIEIRDKGGALIPALAFRLIPATEEDERLLERAGYGQSCVHQSRYIFLANLTAGVVYSDPFSWLNGMSLTMHVAHYWLMTHFDEVSPGGVVDVEYILGETTAPKRSEVNG